MRTGLELPSSCTRLTWVPVMSALLLAVPHAGDAASIVLDAVDAGFVTEMGGSAKGDGTISPGATYNYSVGREAHFADGSLGPPPFPPMDRNNYFVFDLSGVSAEILSASLELYTGTYESVDPAETFDVVAPSDPGAALADTIALAGGTATADFDDPGDPLVGVAMALYGNIAGGAATPLGSFPVSAGDDDSIVSIPIADIAYLTAHAGGMLVLGGTVPTAVPPGSPQQPFGFTGPDIAGTLGGGTPVPKLSLTIVPLPLPVVLLLSGLLSVLAAGGIGRRGAHQRGGRLAR